MGNVWEFPGIVFVLTLLSLCLSALIGVRLRNSRRTEKAWRDDFNIVLAAVLTMLGLIIGFAFSMAVGRYDLRKKLEAEEANAIGTEYVRVNLLPAPDAAKVHSLLRNYLNQRIVFYTTRDKQQLRQLDAYTAQIEGDMWATVAAHALVQPTAVAALILAGMNDVLNSRGYTEAAWLNRIPTAAWILMAAIAGFSNLLMGFGAQRTEMFLFLILPLTVSIAFFLIADIDSPRWGPIRVHPHNLESLSRSLAEH